MSGRVFCSCSEKFSIECRKYTKIALVLLYFALWLVQKTYATLKLKPITSWSPAFSRALFSLFVFTLSSHWLFIVFSFLLIGRCDYFGFGFTTLNQRAKSQSKKKVQNPKRYSYSWSVFRCFRFRFNMLIQNNGNIVRKQWRTSKRKCPLTHLSSYQTRIPKQLSRQQCSWYKKESRIKCFP